MELIRRLLLWLRRPTFGVLLTLAACAGLLGGWSMPVSDALDRLIYDARVNSQAAAFDERVVIVDVDERSLVEEGRWPWPRDQIATLVERIVDRGGASVLGLDTLFAEADRTPGADDALAAMLRDRPVVLGYYFSSDRGGIIAGQLPVPVMSAQSFAQSGHQITTWNGYGANLPVLQQAAGAAGFFNPMVDHDGVVRALPLLAEFDGQVYESLVVAMLRRHLGGASLALTDRTLRLHGPRGRAELPLSTGVSALVPFAGRDPAVARFAEPTLGFDGAPLRPARFAYVSAADILADRVDPSVFKDRIVLLGTSAPGLTDLRATPVQSAFPGVEIHATLLSGALTPASTPIKWRSHTSLATAAVVVGVLGVALAFILPSIGAVGAVVIGVVVSVGLWLFASTAWARDGMVLPIASGLLLIAVLVGFNLAAGYFVERRARRAVASLFGEYVGPALVERMMRDPRRYSVVTSENRELTMLFVDIRGFTQIAENMHPEELREYINDFLTAMTEVVHRYGGTVDKYMGDAVMAFWGAPMEDPQHADHAVAAALSMLEEVRRLNLANELRGLPMLNVGIGINTGEVRVGDLGSRLRRAYTVIGDAVNLASRLEAFTKQFDAPIIVGETTATQARGHSFSPLGREKVPGRVEPVQMFTPVSVVSSRHSSPPSSRNRRDQRTPDTATTRPMPATTGQQPRPQRTSDVSHGVEPFTGNQADEAARIGV